MDCGRVIEKIEHPTLNVE